MRETIKHELIHAIERCGKITLTCSDCMNAEKQAYYWQHCTSPNDPGCNQQDITEIAWYRSCATKTYCIGCNYQNYGNGPWPPQKP